MALVQTRLFTVPHFPVSRDRTLYIMGSHLGWVSNLLRGRGTVWKGEKVELFSSRPFLHRFKPDARPLGTYETKMVARTGKCSIFTILPEKRGLHEQSWCCSAAGIYTELERTTAPSIYIMGKPFSHCILPTDDASHVNNACSRITSLCTRLGSIFPKFNTPRDAATATQVKPHAE